MGSQDTQSLLHSKGKCQQKKPTKWENVFARLTLYRGLVHRKHKELKKFPLKVLLTSEIFWERRLRIFSCVYTGGFTKLQCFVPNPELNRQPLTFEKLSGQQTIKMQRRRKKKTERKRTDRHECGEGIQMCGQQVWKIRATGIFSILVLICQSRSLITKRQHNSDIIMVRLKK